ncbi:MAG TPA: hypothetical protein VEB03_02160, partial [Candidatus Nanoarchaeia archaeon]|nr:hypothetical protein [Candidatus Nanoarchaeia archaeon]
MPFSIRQRVDLSDHARHFSLAHERPSLALQGLVTGIDNVRHDVWLSPKFAQTVRSHLSSLIAKYGTVQDIAAELTVQVQRWQPQRSAPLDFKQMMAELLSAALHRAKAENNICIDLLARLAVIKLLRAELAGQFTNVLERCRAKLKTYDQPKEQLDNRAVEIRERVAAFHLAKKSILRRASQDTLETLRAVERESLGPARISLFGKAYEAQYELLLNTLLFTDDGRDDFVNAEHYVMLGNYDRDPDRFRPLNEIAMGFLESLGFGSGAAGAALDDLLNVPGNAQELLGAGDPSEAHPKYREQKTALAAWVSTLEDEEVIDHV